MESTAESALATWHAPQCPFTIEYAPRVLDDIRLAVVDAFFSLPRGGAEIGGILLGKYAGRRLVISDYLALDCEHAFGPSFALSPKDEAQLAELLASAGGNAVGWYHSHTRSEIFLSEADLNLHKRYFFEPWQVALVLKPHTFQPTRAGFFFREAGGEIHGTASYEEFVLEALPVRPVPSGVVPQQPGRPPGPPPFRREPEPRGPVITVAAGTVPEAPPPAPPAAAPAPEADLPLPKFLAVEPGRSWRGPTILLAITIGLAMAGSAFQTRQLWLPRLMATVRPVFSPSPPLSIGLSTIDTDGQLQIRWDRNSAAVRTGVQAILEITDGASPQAIQLDPPHLQTGAFTYGRQGEKVDVKLMVHLPDGQRVQEVASFLGKLPERKPPPEDPEVRKQRDELAQQAAKLKTDLNAQAWRAKKLQKSLDEVEKALKEQQRKRLENQIPDVIKQ